MTPCPEFTASRNASIPRRFLRWLTFAASIIALSLGSFQSAEAQYEGKNAADTYRRANEPQILRTYAELLSLPNVAADIANIRRNAEWLRSALEVRGVDARLLTLGDDVPPIVYGETLVPGATRTLGIYVHYDGQPADPSNWTHAPWEPTLYDGSMPSGGNAIPFPADGESVNPEWMIYARSAGDDKAPLGAIFPVLDALNAEGITPTSNIKFFFEGEEEAGSEHLEEYLVSNRDILNDIDVWLFFDGPVHQSGTPLLTFGVRGVTSLELTIYGASRSLHSGHYGNWAPVPGQMMAHLLASMKDPEGNVLVDGFYDTATPIGDEEKQALANLPDYDDTLKEELGLVTTEGAGQSLAERLLLPSLTVRGLSSGNVGALARNVIPQVAIASLGIRMVAGNEPTHMQDLVEAHIRQQGYHIVREDPDEATRLAHGKIVKITRGGGYPAARSAMGTPVIQQLIAATMNAASDKLVLQPALGGSLPLYLFTELMGKPAVVVPIANHDDNQHAPDENLRISNLWYGISLYGSLLTMPPGDLIP